MVAVIKLVKNHNSPAVIHMLVCSWCRFDRFIFCAGFSRGFGSASVMLPWAVSRCGLICQGRNASLMGCQLTWPPSLLLTLSPSLFPCHTALFLQVHPYTFFHLFPPSMSTSHSGSLASSCLTFFLLILFLSCVFLSFIPHSSHNCFMSPASLCLLPTTPYITVFPAALLPSCYLKWSLPMGNMINRLHFTGFQESWFHLTSTSMGTQPFNSPSAGTARGNPPGHLHWRRLRRTKTRAINL